MTSMAFSTGTEYRTARTALNASVFERGELYLGWHDISLFGQEARETVGDGVTPSVEFVDTFGSATTSIPLPPPRSRIVRRASPATERLGAAFPASPAGSRLKLTLSQLAGMASETSESNSATPSAFGVSAESVSLSGADVAFGNLLARLASQEGDESADAAAQAVTGYCESFGNAGLVTVQLRVRELLGSASIDALAPALEALAESAKLEGRRIVLEIMRDLLRHSRPSVRDAAALALLQLRDASSRRALQSALSGEGVPQVRRNMEAILLAMA